MDRHVWKKNLWKEQPFLDAFFSIEARARRAMCERMFTLCDGCGGYVSVHLNDYDMCWTIDEDDVGVAGCQCDEGYTPYVKGISPFPLTSNSYKPCYLVQSEYVLAEVQEVLDRVVAGE